MISLCFLMAISLSHKQDMKHTISKNKMTVRWQVEGDLIHFEMEAPTKGWVAIGFNETDQITGAYLLMGRVRHNKTEVLEHFTESPGNYHPLENYGIVNQVRNISGTEKDGRTTLKFSIPLTPASRYHKKLWTGKQWWLILAYSREDDFQHHSVMRTSESIKL